MIIQLLFWLLGNTYTKLYSISYLFGATTQNHESRKKKWERALARMWKNKDLLDFLFYQAESDKEAVFRGKIRKELSVGARIRTLFIIYSAHRAYESQIKNRTPDESEQASKKLGKVGKVYKEITNFK